MIIDPDQPSPHYPVRPQWLALHTETALYPEQGIVDPHHHLWDRKADGRYFMHDLLADMDSGHRILDTVFMECGAMYRADGPEEERSLGETEFANGVAAMSASGAYGATRICRGIVGSVDLRLGAGVESVLDKHLAIAGERFKGIRHISAWHDDPTARGSLANPPTDLFEDRNFREGLRRLAAKELTFDAYMYHTQLTEAVDVARAVPEATIILNHVGGAIGIGPYAGKRDEVFTAWRKDMQTLSTCSNVVVKLGGMGMRVFGFGHGENARPPTSEELALAWNPYVESLIELFGPSRCMFESNFPVDKGSCSYGVIWNAFKRICASASANEKNDLFQQTARRIYKLGEGSAT